MNKNLFEVGEKVRLVSSVRGDMGIGVVLSCSWMESALDLNGNVVKNVWFYETTIASLGTSKRWFESSLRKLPPPADCTYEELIKELNTPVTETV